VIIFFSTLSLLEDTNVVEKVIVNRTKKCLAEIVRLWFISAIIQVVYNSCLISPSSLSFCLHFLSSPLIDEYFSRTQILTAQDIDDHFARMNNSLL
jgi:hypothetical protein